MELKCASFPGSGAKNVFLIEGALSLQVTSNNKFRINYKFDGGAPTDDIIGYSSGLTTNTYAYFEIKQTLAVDKVIILYYILNI